VDKKTIVLVALLVLVLLFWGKITEYLGLTQPPAPAKVTTTVTDTVTAAVPPQEKEAVKDTTASTLPILTANIDTLIPEKLINVKTPLYELTFSTRGGGLKKIFLKQYHYKNYKNNGDVVLADDKEKVVPDFQTANGAYSMAHIPFTCDQTDFELAAGAPAKKVTFTFDNGKGGQVIKTYTINSDRYDLDLALTLNGIENLGFERSYQLTWGITPPPTEQNAKDDYGYFKAEAMMSGDRLESEFKDGKMLDDIPGSTTWAGLRTKYFAAVMIPRSRPGEGIKTRGQEIPVTVGTSQFKARELSTGIDMSINGMGTVVDSFTLYAGPIEYKILNGYNIGLEEMTSMGWKIIRPFSIAIIWLLPKIYSIFPNYGVVVLVFALMIKLILFPLSRKQTIAMNKMRDLQPKMKAIQEKFKNDPAKLNKEVMKMYKEAGANPLSGCLLMLPQMPLMYALFIVFRTTIEFRGASFMFWISDLSLADPYYVLPVVMTVSMFFQQRLANTDPKNKMLTYMMPLIFGWMFLNFPAGLNLYWTGYNILSLLEAHFLRKNMNSSEAVVLDDPK
jgi:YidC/Oxa1 family membrane protein insertase